jgi:hypothetical protein
MQGRFSFKKRGKRSSSALAAVGSSRATDAVREDAD